MKVVKTYGHVIAKSYKSKKCEGTDFGWSEWSDPNENSQHYANLLVSDSCRLSAQ